MKRLTFLSYSLEGDSRTQASQITGESLWTHFHYPESKSVEDLTLTMEEVPSLPSQFSGL